MNIGLNGYVVSKMNCSCIGQSNISMIYGDPIAFQIRSK